MTDQTNTTAAPATSVEYLGAPRSVIIQLLHPFKIGEREFREVVVRRPTGVEVKAYGFAVSGFWNSVKSGRAADEPLFPGIELPREAFAALDDDDLAVIEEAADGFFPERLRPMMEALNGMLALAAAPDSMPVTGESEQVSSAPS